MRRNKMNLRKEIRKTLREQKKEESLSVLNSMKRLLADIDPENLLDDVVQTQMTLDELIDNDFFQNVSIDIKNKVASFNDALDIIFKSIDRASALYERLLGSINREISIFVDEKKEFEREESLASGDTELET